MIEKENTTNLEEGQQEELFTTTVEFDVVRIVEPEELTCDVAGCDEPAKYLILWQFEHGPEHSLAVCDRGAEPATFWNELIAAATTRPEATP